MSQVVITIKTEFTLEINIMSGDFNDVEQILRDNNWKFDKTMSVFMKRLTLLIFDMNLKKVWALKKLLKDKSINNYY